jgi:hypothetical protein
LKRTGKKTGKVMTTDTDPSGNDQTPRRRTRLEDEVLEILTRADRPPTRLEKLRSWRWRRGRWGTSRRLRRGRSTGFGNGSWLLASAIAGILALVLDGPSPLIARILAILCIVCFAVPIVARWRKPDEPEIKRWRGRDIDFRDSGSDFIEDLKRRFRRPGRK